MASRAITLPLRLSRRALVAALPASFFPLPGLGEGLRPPDWATRHKPEIPGLPNLHRVTPWLYRSAQPEAEGLVAARDLGIQTVISLRQTVKDEPVPGLDLQRIPMKARAVGEKDGAKVVAALGALRAGLARGPVLVHCHHGADRTGLIIALYRMLAQGWTRDAAIEEMTLGGYGFHPVWANIPRYLARVDLSDLRARAWS